MPTKETASGLKVIDDKLGLHEIIASVRQLSFMRQHITTLLKTLNVQLEVTYAKAPAGRLGKGQTYELQRSERADPRVRERWLEKLMLRMTGGRQGPCNRQRRRGTIILLFWLTIRRQYA